MASEAKHTPTPGPWEIFPNPRIAENGQRFGVQSRNGPIVADCGWVENIHSLANAHLISAAPEMLEALKLAKEALRGHDPEQPYVRAIRGAIAKAEGRSNA